MKWLYFLTSLFLFTNSVKLSSQAWVDTLYQIETIEDIVYGEAIDFAGNLRSLLMDISYPTNDTIPENGRPLLIAVHGGGFIAGSKVEGLPPYLMRDFAKRGYTTASINYRLGQFQTHQQVHCNISNFGLEWDCLNMADTSEWYRAYFRGIQDTHGAIRYLVNHAADYQVNPQQIFVVGESAGAFIAMGVGFLNEETEILNGQNDSLPPLQGPNSIYEAPCIQGYGLDTSILSLNLERPALGSIQGTLNMPVVTDYCIQGIGAFYGAVFNNIFLHSDVNQPALYLFHQPGDLIVPYNTGRVYGGFAYCATQFPAFCQYIINRPIVSGSNAIVSMLEEMESDGLSVPEYLFEHTSNNATCAEQILNSTLQAHKVDNYWLRSTNMAAFFASQMGGCTTTVATTLEKKAPPILVYPNPAEKKENLFIQLAGIHGRCLLQLYDIRGKLVKQTVLTNPTNAIPLTDLNTGLYIILAKGKEYHYTTKVLVK